VWCRQSLPGATAPLGYWYPALHCCSGKHPFQPGLLRIEGRHPCRGFAGPGFWARHANYCSESFQRHRWTRNERSVSDLRRTAPGGEGEVHGPAWRRSSSADRAGCTKEDGYAGLVVSYFAVITGRDQNRFRPAGVRMASNACNDVRAHRGLDPAAQLHDCVDSERYWLEIGHS
jgi:hypothetical protein